MMIAEGSVVVDSGATAWMLTSTALVLLMVSGPALFYGGLVCAKNVLCSSRLYSFANHVFRDRERAIK